MEFNYKKLGNLLAMYRMEKNLRQIDLEVRSEDRLKQPAISAAERGETRVAVDTLVDYCNAIGIRPDAVLEPFLTTRPEKESEEVIVDPYVIQLARIMQDCSADQKILLLQIAQVIREHTEG